MEKWKQYRLKLFCDTVKTQLYLASLQAVIAKSAIDNLGRNIINGSCHCDIDTALSKDQSNVCLATPIILFCRMTP